MSKFVDLPTLQPQASTEAETPFSESETPNDPTALIESSLLSSGASPEVKALLMDGSNIAKTDLPTLKPSTEAETPFTEAETPYDALAASFESSLLNSCASPELKALLMGGSNIAKADLAVLMKQMSEETPFGAPAESMESALLNSGANAEVVAIMMGGSDISKADLAALMKQVSEEEEEEEDE